MTTLGKHLSYISSKAKSFPGGFMKEHESEIDQFIENLKTEAEECANKGANYAQLTTESFKHLPTREPVQEILNAFRGQNVKIRWSECLQCAGRCEGCGNHTGYTIEWK